MEWEAKMNRIRVNRMLLAGLVTMIVYILIELLWETLIGSLVLSVMRLHPEYADVLNPPGGIWDYGKVNQVVNIGVGLVICILLIWLYAALRPMFGVGPRNALITGGFVFAFMLALTINYVNLGFLPVWFGAVEQVNLLVELPLSLVAGAYVYESG